MVSNTSRQKGIVLLSAMLIVITATTIMVSISHDEAFSIRKTGRIQALERAGLYGMGLEDWARTFLRKDYKDSKIDHLKEDWAIAIPGLPIEDGFLSGFLEDEQAKFNINNLLGPPESMKRFKQLCDNLEIECNFTDALLDWMDSDFNITYPDGVEDTYKNYRVANRPLVDISELLLIKNMSVDTYNTLKPHVTALPAITNLNVNTMSGTVFKSLDANLDDELFLDEREKAEFKNVQDFITRLQKPIPIDGLSVDTNYFLAHGQVTQGEQSYAFDSLIHRDSNGATSVLNRTLGGL